jgi:hypothetical protein
MPRPADVQIVSQSHTFQLDPFGAGGRRVVRYVIIVTHDKGRNPSGPFTIDIPVEDWTTERTWAEFEKVASKARDI